MKLLNIASAAITTNNIERTDESMRRTRESMQTQNVYDSDSDTSNIDNSHIANHLESNDNGTNHNEWSEVELLISRNRHYANENNEM